MAIVVEFFGIPRVRAGVERVEVLRGRESASVSEILSEVAKQFPDFAETCMTNRRLRTGFIASIDGQCFVQDDDMVVDRQQSVLILSADAGG
jgi:hypothetical protein